MGDGTKENPYTREDVLRLIQEHGGKAEGLDLSHKWFELGIDLEECDLNGIILINAHLDGAYLRHLKGARLDLAHLDGASLMLAHLEWANLSFAHLKDAHLRGTHFEGAYLGGAHLEGADLWNAHLEGANFGDAEFSPKTRLEEVDWGNFILGRERQHQFGTAAATYRRLKQWYTNAGMYDVAGKFYYREMEAKRKAQNWKKKPHLKLWNWVMRWLCGYGEKPERVVVSALVIIFGLAIAYYLLGSFDTSSFWDTLYYSAVSFISLGYGNWAPQPTGWAKSIGVLEAFVGFFMMTLFLVTFTRKMTR